MPSYHSTLIDTLHHSNAQHFLQELEGQHNPSIIANPSCALWSRTRLLLRRLEVWKWRGSRVRVGPCGERCSRLDAAPSLSHVFSLLDTSSHSRLVVQRLLRKTEQLPEWWEDSGCCTRRNDLAERVDCRWKTATKEERARKSRYYSILSSTGQLAGQVFATGQQVQRGRKLTGQGNPGLIKCLKVTFDRFRLSGVWRELGKRLNWLLIQLQ